jgi:16S rRNA (guanine966-N2)-methyltransferase
MRIIAGTLGGRRIAAPPGSATRPTSDRVREALFNILGPPPSGARILDLFAGSGALALEAISRGADSAVLVDSSRAAARTARKNAASLGIADRVDIRVGESAAALRRLEAEAVGPAWRGPFTWVFLDPPYRDPALAVRALDALAAGTLLAPGAVVAVEHDRRAEPDPERGFLVKAGGRRYGDTSLSLYRVSQP